MRLTTILLVLFFMTALTIGTTMDVGDREKVDDSLNTAIASFENISIDESNSTIPNINGFYDILEKYVQFVGTLCIEGIRAGIYFGQENPEYFEAEFMYRIMKLIVILIIISLLIKPAGYLIVFIIVGIIALNDRIKKRRVSKKFKFMKGGNPDGKNKS